MKKISSIKLSLCTLLIFCGTFLFNCSNLEQGDNVSPANIDNLTNEYLDILNYFKANGFEIEKDKITSAKSKNNFKVSNLQEAKKIVDEMHALKENVLSESVNNQVSVKNGRLAEIPDCFTEGTYELRNVLTAIASHVDYEFGRDAQGNFIGSSFKPDTKGMPIGLVGSGFRAV
ncbi:MAG: hypothetical protein U5N85_16025 [Arcicella sp.]|nr:hypothetical protein [Arcicella sp.]